jgi:hypothetical protein
MPTRVPQQLEPLMILVQRGGQESITFNKPHVKCDHQRPQVGRQAVAGWSRTRPDDEDRHDRLADPSPGGAGGRARRLRWPPNGISSMGTPGRQTPLPGIGVEGLGGDLTAFVTSKIR